MARKNLAAVLESQSRCTVSSSVVETASFSLCTLLAVALGRVGSTKILQCRIEAALADGVVPVSPGSAGFLARSQSTRWLSKHQSQIWTLLSASICHPVTQLERGYADHRWKLGPCCPRL